MTLTNSAQPHPELHFTDSESVRDIVIRMSDGLTVPFAVAAGLSGAVESSGNSRGPLSGVGHGEFMGPAAAHVHRPDNVAIWLPRECNPRGKSVGGGGRLEFGKFREEVEQAVKEAGWEFVFAVV